MVRNFSVSHADLPAGRLEGSRSWEETQLGQLTSADQRDIPCGVMLSIYTLRKARQGLLLRAWVGVTVSREWAITLFTTCFYILYSTYSIFCILILLLFSPFLFCTIRLSLSQPTNFTFFPSSLLHHTERGRKWVAMWFLAACWVKPQQLHKSKESKKKIDAQNGKINFVTERLPE